MGLQGGGRVKRRSELNFALRPGCAFHLHGIPAWATSGRACDCARRRPDILERRPLLGSSKTIHGVVVAVGGDHPLRDRSVDARAFPRPGAWKCGPMCQPICVVRSDAIAGARKRFGNGRPIPVVPPVTRHRTPVSHTGASATPACAIFHSTSVGLQPEQIACAASTAMRARHAP